LDFNKRLNIVLHEPEIPGNTGSIGRLCVGLEANLILIEPLGFSLEDKYMRRAGLDYWQHLSWTVLPSIETLLEQVPDPERLFFLTTKSSKPYVHAGFKRGDFLIFGKETKGLPEPLLKAHWDRAFTIPMFGEVRSLNLAVATGIVAYEAVRQIEGDFR
jgi:tRNA (cytidine/uridine-2'-O-)-methyltransferase